MNEKSYMLEEKHYRSIAKQLSKIQDILRSDEHTDYESLIEAADRQEQKRVIDNIQTRYKKNKGGIITSSELENLKRFVNSLRDKVYDSETENKLKYSIDSFNMKLKEIGVEVNATKNVPTEFNVHK
jgi:hypothetical protein